jgi:hypothetical protein
MSKFCLLQNNNSGIMSMTEVDCRLEGGSVANDVISGVLLRPIIFFHT